MSDENESDLFGGALGLVIRQALSQAGGLREIVEREAQSTRDWLDRTLRERRRKDVLSGLGKEALRAFTEERIGEADIPGISECSRQIQAIDNQQDPAAVKEPPKFEPWNPKEARDQRADTILDDSPARQRESDD